MNGESEATTMTLGNGEQPSAQDTLDSDRIVTVETLGNEIATVITQANRLQRFEYVTGEVAEYRVSSRDHAHFQLVHENVALHCVIFDVRRATITTTITNGMQVAVTGDLLFFSQDNHCSIEVEEVVPTEADDSQRAYADLPVRLWIAIAVLLVIVLWSVGFFFFLL